MNERRHNPKSVAAEACAPWRGRLGQPASLLGAAAVLLLLSATAHAHKVNIWAYAEGETVFVEGFFRDGKPCRNSVITVFDRAGKELLDGKTDEEGKFSFDAPASSDLRIVLDAGMGHRAECVVKASELPDDPPPVAGASAPEPADKPEPPARAADAEAIRKIVEETLEKELKPIRDMIRKSRLAGPSPTEIIGGIGYIVGLAGVIMYVRSKWRKT